MNTYHRQLLLFELKWDAKMRALREKYVCDLPKINNAYSMNWQIKHINGVIDSKTLINHETRTVYVSIVVGQFQYNNLVLQETIKLYAKTIVMNRAKEFQYKVEVQVLEESQNYLLLGDRLKQLSQLATILADQARHAIQHMAKVIGQINITKP